MLNIYKKLLKKNKEILSKNIFFRFKQNKNQILCAIQGNHENYHYFIFFLQRKKAIRVKSAKFLF